MRAASDIEGFDAVILGSGIYMGRWLEPATAFVDAHAEELATRPSWLFSSGPLGDPGKPDDDDAAAVQDMLERIGPCEHRLFRAQLDRGRRRGGGGAERARLRDAGRAVERPASERPLPLRTHRATRERRELRDRAGSGAGLPGCDTRRCRRWSGRCTLGGASANLPLRD